MDSSEKWGLGGVALIILAVIVAVGGWFWYEWRYPCLRQESYPCNRRYCVAWVKSTCVSWKTDTTCTRCVQRGDRESMPAEVP